MKDLILPQQINTDELAPYEIIKVLADRQGSPVPDEFKDKVIIDAIHDGNTIPEKFLHGLQSQNRSDETLKYYYCKERDWGAELVAGYLASALHLEDYFRVNVARTLLDFGRFPGITGRAADHMTKFAINYPFSESLSFDQKRELLEDYYDVISLGLENYAEDKLLKIAIHSYDEKSPNNVRRPSVSIVTRSLGHQSGLDIPVTMFDPLVPDELAELTVDPILRARLALRLEESAIPVADNYPYCFPEGSVEVRSQVWYFFRYVQHKYDLIHPNLKTELVDNVCPRTLVWNMLLDTNLRSAQSEALRSYLHMFRKAPAGDETLFHDARQEYEKIAEFIHCNNNEILRGYRNFMQRPSSLLIEVRKDLIWEFNNNKPIKPRFENAQMIARTLASAVQTYWMTDRAEKTKALNIFNDRYM